MKNKEMSPDKIESYEKKISDLEEKVDQLSLLVKHYEETL
jgi:exonuclease VII small subunit